jgi:peptidoglycan/LPS O-acetylase OafA/YrhL
MLLIYWGVRSPAAVLVLSLAGSLGFGAASWYAVERWALKLRVHHPVGISSQGRTTLEGYPVT